MNGFKAYLLYLSLKTHFNHPDYDYFKFQGKSPATFDTFEKRNDKYFFEKIATIYPNKERLLGFYVSNLLINKNFYIGDYCSRLCEKKYQEWVGRIQSLLYCFEQDLRKLEKEAEEKDITFRDIFRIDSGESASRFLEMTLEGVITLETYILVDNILGLTDYYDGKIIDPLYEEFAFKVKKYSPFIQLDRAKFVQLFEKFI